MDFDLTRRSFLKSAIASPFTASAGRPGAFALGLRPGPQELFENPHIIRYDAHCFTLHQKDQFISAARFIIRAARGNSGGTAWKSSSAPVSTPSRPTFSGTITSGARARATSPSL